MYCNIHNHNMSSCRVVWLGGLVTSFVSCCSAAYRCWFSVLLFAFVPTAWSNNPLHNCRSHISHPLSIYATHNINMVFSVINPAHNYSMGYPLKGPCAVALCKFCVAIFSCRFLSQYCFQVFLHLGKIDATLYGEIAPVICFTCNICTNTH